ncbi:NADH-quinone oxidoreductase subunit N [soil metagenome]
MEDMMMVWVGDIVPELVLLVGGVTVLLYSLAAPRRLQVGAALIALATIVAALAVSALMLDGPERLTFAGTYARDGAALWAKLIVLVATAAVIGLSIPWFRSDARHGEYYTLLLFSALGSILLAGATDLMELVVALLLSSATGYVLTAYHRRARPSAEAGIKYFLLGALTSAGMLLGVALLFGAGGTTTYAGAEPGLADGGPAVVAGAGLVVTALAFKMGSVPVHQWMPDVAEGAPAPVAAFVTAVPKVGGLVAVARFMVILPEDALGWRPLVAVLAAATMTVGNLAALWQDDVRRLLGWSAVSQTGYGLMGVVALGRSELALPSVLFFLVAYVLANIAAFGVVVELRGRTALSDYDGLAAARPLLAASLVVAFLSFIGIPPLAGFGAKLALFATAIEAGYTWLAALAVINTVVSIAYYARVIAPMYFAPRMSQAVPVLGQVAAFPTVACALGVVAAGVAAEVFLNAFMPVSLLP